MKDLNFWGEIPDLNYLCETKGSPLSPFSFRFVLFFSSWQKFEDDMSYWTSLGRGGSEYYGGYYQHHYDEDSPIGPRNPHTFRHGAGVNYDDYWWLSSSYSWGAWGWAKPCPPPVNVSASLLFMCNSRSQGAAKKETWLFFCYCYLVVCDYMKCYRNKAFLIKLPII